MSGNFEESCCYEPWPNRWPTCPGGDELSNGQSQLVHVLTWTSDDQDLCHLCYLISVAWWLWLLMMIMMITYDYMTESQPFSWILITILVYLKLLNALSITCITQKALFIYLGVSVSNFTQKAMFIYLGVSVSNWRWCDFLNSIRYLIISSFILRRICPIIGYFHWYHIILSTYCNWFAGQVAGDMPYSGRLH